MRGTVFGFDAPTINTTHMTTPPHPVTANKHSILHIKANGYTDHTQLNGYIQHKHNNHTQMNGYTQHNDHTQLNGYAHVSLGHMTNRCNGGKYEEQPHGLKASSSAVPVPHVSTEHVCGRGLVPYLLAFAHTVDIACLKVQILKSNIIIMLNKFYRNFLVV